MWTLRLIDENVDLIRPDVLVMLLTTKYVDGLPLHRFEKVLGLHGVDIPRQTLARWVIQCGEHPLSCLTTRPAGCRRLCRASKAIAAT